MLNERRQLVTTDYAALKAWCLAQPVPSQESLRKFVELMAQEQALRPSKKWCYARTSYGLKHVVERLSDLFGDFIIAMVQAGFELKNSLDGWGLPGPNYYFKMPRPSARLAKKIQSLKPDNEPPADTRRPRLPDLPIY